MAHPGSKVKINVGVVLTEKSYPVPGYRHRNGKEDDQGEAYVIEHLTLTEKSIEPVERKKPC